MRAKSSDSGTQLATELHRGTGTTLGKYETGDNIIAIVIIVKILMIMIKCYCRWQ